MYICTYFSYAWVMYVTYVSHTYVCTFVCAWKICIVLKKYEYLPGIGIIKSVLAVVGETELINTSHWYTLPISLMLSDEMINESLYVDVEFMSLTAATLLTLLTCVLPVVHMMSTVLLILLTIVALHCNINGWLITGLVAITSIPIIGSIYVNHKINESMQCTVFCMRHSMYKSCNTGLSDLFDNALKDQGSNA